MVQISVRLTVVKMGFTTELTCCVIFSFENRGRHGHEEYKYFRITSNGLDGDEAELFPHKEVSRKQATCEYIAFQ